MKIVLRVLPIALLILVVLLTFARRDFSGAWIAFESNREGSPAIFLMTGDGGTIRRITPDHKCGIEPRWSSDGRWIAFANSCTYSRELLRIRPGGATPHLLASSLPFAQAGLWSPDGDWVLVIRNESDLVLVRADAGEERLLASAYAQPFWSPDGQWIYASPFDRPRSQLDRIHIETSRVETLLADTRFASPGWSPDGSHLLLVISTDHGDELFTMNPDGSALTALPINLPPPRLAEPQWSSDGAWIAFLGGETFIDQHLYRIRPDGSALEQLTAQTGDLLNIQWSPDGAWLLFGANYERSWDVYRLRADGSTTIENLTPGNARELLPQYAPISGLEWRPFWLMAVAVLMFLAPLITNALRGRQRGFQTRSYANRRRTSL
jgi:TolB protein